MNEECVAVQLSMSLQGHPGCKKRKKVTQQRRYATLLRVLCLFNLTPDRHRFWGRRISQFSLLVTVHHPRTQILPVKVALKALNVLSKTYRSTFIGFVRSSIILKFQNNCISEMSLQLCLLLCCAKENSHHNP